MLEFTKMLGLLTAIILSLSLRGNRESRKRSAQLAARAQSLGLEHFHDKTPKAILDKPFYLERIGAYPGKDIIRGHWRGLPVSYVDYRRMIPSSLYGPAGLADYSVVCAALNIEVPHLRVGRKYDLRQLAGRLRNRTDDSPIRRFDRKFRVKSQDSGFAGKLIDADMMAWLLSSDAKLNFELSGRRLAVYTTRLGFMDPQRLFDAAVEFTAHIPKAVLDEYGSSARPL